MSPACFVVFCGSLCKKRVRDTWSAACEAGLGESEGGARRSAASEGLPGTGLVSAESCGFPNIFALKNKMLKKHVLEIMKLYISSLRLSLP